MNRLVSYNDPTLERVQRQFELWRSERSSRREPIPEHLWQAAAELCREHSISRVSRQLHLSYAELKKQIAEDDPPPVGFMEIDLDLSPSRWQIECARSDGSQLRISGNGQPPAIKTVLRSFLS